MSACVIIGLSISQIYEAKSRGTEISYIFALSRNNVVFVIT